jgi:hypothetical protein
MPGEGTETHQLFSLLVPFFPPKTSPLLLPCPATPPRETEIFVIEKFYTELTAIARPFNLKRNALPLTTHSSLKYILFRFQIFIGAIIVSFYHF